MKQRIILAGGGHAHLAVLADWAVNPLQDAECLLITSARHTAYSGMLPGWMAGVYEKDELLIDLAPLARNAGVELVLANVIGLDADARRLHLSTGEVVDFTLASLATGGEVDTGDLAGMDAALLPVKPVPQFMTGWQGLLESLVHGHAANVAIVGGGAAGVEMALAAAAALRQRAAPGSVTLITPAETFLRGHSPAVKRLAIAELKRGGIAIRYGRAATEDGRLMLDDGTEMAADCVIAASGSRAPRWLASSGLACTAKGFIAIGADLHSLSHPYILAAGDIVERADRRLPRSGVHAVKAGPVLAANLRAAAGKGRAAEYQPRSRTLYLMATGDQRAILSWGRFATCGRLAWRIKDWIDTRFVRHYQR